MKRVSSFRLAVASFGGCFGTLLLLLLLLRDTVVQSHVLPHYPHGQRRFRFLQHAHYPFSPKKGDTTAKIRWTRTLEDAAALDNETTTTTVQRNDTFSTKEPSSITMEPSSLEPSMVPSLQPQPSPSPSTKSFQPSFGTQPPSVLLSSNPSSSPSMVPTEVSPGTDPPTALLETTSNSPSRYPSVSMEPSVVGSMDPVSGVVSSSSSFVPTVEESTRPSLWEESSSLPPTVLPTKSIPLHDFFVLVVIHWDASNTTLGIHDSSSNNELSILWRWATQTTMWLEDSLHQGLLSSSNGLYRDSLLQTRLELERFEEYLTTTDIDNDHHPSKDNPGYLRRKLVTESGKETTIPYSTTQLRLDLSGVAVFAPHAPINITELQHHQRQTLSLLQAGNATDTKNATLQLDGGNTTVNIQWIRMDGQQQQQDHDKDDNSTGISMDPQEEPEEKTTTVIRIGGGVAAGGLVLVGVTLWLVFNRARRTKRDTLPSKEVVNKKSMAHPNGDHSYDDEECQTHMAVLVVDSSTWSAAEDTHNRCLSDQPSPETPPLVSSWSSADDDSEDEEHRDSPDTDLVLPMPVAPATTVDNNNKIITFVGDVSEIQSTCSSNSDAGLPSMEDITLNDKTDGTQSSHCNSATRTTVGRLSFASTAAVMGPSVDESHDGIADFSKTSTRHDEESIRQQMEALLYGVEVTSRESPDCAAAIGKSSLESGTSVYVDVQQASCTESQVDANKSDAGTVPAVSNEASTSGDDGPYAVMSDKNNNQEAIVPEEEESTETSNLELDDLPSNLSLVSPPSEEWGIGGAFALGNNEYSFASMKGNYSVPDSAGSNRSETDDDTQSIEHDKSLQVDSVSVESPASGVDEEEQAAATFLLHERSCSMHVGSLASVSLTDEDDGPSQSDQVYDSVSGSIASASIQQDSEDGSSSEPSTKETLAFLAQCSYLSHTVLQADYSFEKTSVLADRLLLQDSHSNDSYVGTDDDTRSSHAYLSASSDPYYSASDMGSIGSSGRSYKECTPLATVIQRNHQKEQLVRATELMVGSYLAGPRSDVPSDEDQSARFVDNHPDNDECSSFESYDSP